MIDLSEIKLTYDINSLEYKEISDAEYFSKKYSGYISNSSLGLINPKQDGSYQKYKEGFSKHGLVTDSLLFGSAVHEMVLQPEDFEVAWSVKKPSGKSGMIGDYLFNRYVENKTITKEDIKEASIKFDFYNGNPSENREKDLLDKIIPYFKSRIRFENNYKGNKELIYLDKQNLSKLEECLSNVSNHSEIQMLLNPDKSDFIWGNEHIIKNESALFLTFKAEHNGKEVLLLFKSKLDNFTIDPLMGKVVLNDLKTTGHILSSFGMGSFVNYRYARQMAIYSLLLRLYSQHHLKIDVQSQEANMLLIQSIPDYRCGIYKVSDKEILDGWEEFKFLMKRVAALEMYGLDECMEQDS